MGKSKPRFSFMARHSSESSAGGKNGLWESMGVAENIFWQHWRVFWKFLDDPMPVSKLSDGRSWVIFCCHSRQLGYLISVNFGLYGAQSIEYFRFCWSAGAFLSLWSLWELNWCRCKFLIYGRPEQNISSFSMDLCNFPASLIFCWSLSEQSGTSTIYVVGSKRG